MIDNALNIGLIRDRASSVSRNMVVAIYLECRQVRAGKCLTQALDDIGSQLKVQLSEHWLLFAPVSDILKPPLKA